MKNIIIKRGIYLFALMLLPLLVIGCAGGRLTMTANNLQHPVSTTEGLYDPNYKLLGEEDYEKVGNFDFSVSKWSLFWTLIPLSGDPDISDDLNKIIKEKGGDAIINLQVNVSGVAGSIPNFLASVVPIIPGVVTASITGDVIKVKK
jgi:hypothetical protein